jgi:sodium/pantothenate symporter
LKTAAPSFEADEPSFGLLLGAMVALAMRIIVEPRLLSRFYGLRDVAAARTGMITSLSALAFVLVFLLPIGLMARQVFPDGSMDPDMIVPTLIASDQWVHPAIGAFLFLALLAAAMSSLDSVLLVAATTTHRDILGLVRAEGHLSRTVFETRLSTGAIGIVTAVIAINPPGGIIPLTAISGSLYSACLTASILFGLFATHTSRPAAIASMVVGAATLLIGSLSPLSDLVHPIFPATGLSLLTYLAVKAWRTGSSAA